MLSREGARSQGKKTDRMKVDKIFCTHIRSDFGRNVLGLLIAARVAFAAFLVLALALGAFLVVFLVSVGFLAPLK
jgi:hypothetical protein